MITIGIMVFMVIAIGADMAMGWLHKDGQIFVCFDCHVQFSDSIITPGPSLIKEQYDAINLLCRSCHSSGDPGTDSAFTIGARAKNPANTDRLFKGLIDWITWDPSVSP